MPSNVFQCLPMSSNVFQCLPMSANVFQCLPCFSIFQFFSIFVFVEISTVDRVCIRYQSVSRKRQADMDDMGMNKKKKQQLRTMM